MFTKTLRAIGDGFNSLANSWENRKGFSYFAGIQTLFGLFTLFPVVGVVGVIKGYVISDIGMVLFGLLITIAGSVFSSVFFVEVYLSERQTHLKTLGYNARRNHPTFVRAPEI